MNAMAIKAIVRNGRVEIDAPDEWPEGTQVMIEALPQEESLGMREEDWPTTPEGIAALLKSWKEMEPLEMTPDEEAAWNAWRQKVKEYTIANMDKGIAEIWE